MLSVWQLGAYRSSPEGSGAGSDSVKLAPFHRSDRCDFVIDPLAGEDAAAGIAKATVSTATAASRRRTALLHVIQRCRHAAVRTAREHEPGTDHHVVGLVPELSFE